MIREHCESALASLRVSARKAHHPPKTGAKHLLSYDPYRAEVNHEVRKTDKRGCDWGTNANKNAAVISGRLNRYFYNNYPLKKEVEQINSVPPYTP